MWVGRRGQVQEGCKDKKRQVTEPETGAGNVYCGSTSGGRAGLGRFVLGQGPALLREGQGRACVMGQLEAGILGFHFYLATWPLSQSHLVDSSQLLNLAQPMGDTPPTLPNV